MTEDTKTHGHEGTYDSQCLLCEPPQEPHAAWLAGFAAAMVIIVSAGVFNMTSNWSEDHYNAFMYGVEVTYTFFLGLIICAMSIAIAFLIVVLTMGAITAGVHHLSRYVKYIMLRIRYGR